MENVYNFGVDNMIFQGGWTMLLNIKMFLLGAWVVQPVEALTLDLGSGLNVRVVSSSATLGSVLGMEPTEKKNIPVDAHAYQNMEWSVI